MARQSTYICKTLNRPVFELPTSYLLTKAGQHAKLNPGTKINTGMFFNMNVRW